MNSKPIKNYGLIDSMIQKIRLDNTKQLMYVLIQLIVSISTYNCIIKYNKWNID